MIRAHYDEIRVGDRSVTRGRTITEADLVGFSMLSGDWFPLHTDAEYAKGTVFGERIAHGMLVLSVATGLVELKPGAVIAFYGIEDLRFVRPTRIGDTVHAETEVVSTEDRGESSGLVTSRLVVKNQREGSVLSARLKMLVARGPQGSS